MAWSNGSTMKKNAVQPMAKNRRPKMIAQSGQTTMNSTDHASRTSTFASGH